ncbi:MAG: serine/threonine-protein phosphatase [Prevotella sp.]|nr:serine/threonine-protein phosphatase [Prevotella sp.]
MAAILIQNEDSTFVVLDSLESADSYPVCVINLIRGNIYGQLMRLRFAEFYLRKAICQELHDEWPRGYYMGIYNLGLSLQERSNLEEALKVAKAGCEEAEKESDPSLKIWETSLQYIIGGCQLKLKQLNEGDKTMQRCYSQLMERAVADTTHASIEQVGTMSTNIALDYYNHYREAAMPWIERAEKALDLLAEHNKRSQQPSNEPVMRVKLQMIKAVIYVTDNQTDKAEDAYRAVMASPFAEHPILLSDRLVYLEKTNQWDAAANIVQEYADFNEDLDIEDYTMENLSYLGESYNIYEKAGKKDEAAKIARQMAHIVDSVRLYQDKNDAAELAVIYDTQGKEQQIAEQQMRLSRARVLALAVSIIALTIFFVIFTIVRHRAAKRLAKVNAAKERMEGDLRISRDIQMSMVPSKFPDYEGLDMYASMTPAKEVGGDLYGYHLEGDKLYFALGDVSGKGVPASLFMAQATRLFLTHATQGMMPAEICTSINKALAGEDNVNAMFVTMFVGLLNLQTGHLDFCNAGHNAPVLGSGELDGEFLDMLPNAPIGLWPGLEYEGEEIENIKGRQLFIYTDGLNEAENRQQEQFGDDRLLEILRAIHYENARQVIEAIEAEVEKHRDGAEPNDDLTMMCIKL